MMRGQAIWARRAASLAVAHASDAQARLKMASAASAMDAEELGLGPLLTNDVVLQPVLVENTGAGALLRVSADVIESALALHDAAAVVRSVKDAAAVSINDADFYVVDVEPVMAQGVAVVYRIVLRSAGAVI